MSVIQISSEEEFNSAINKQIAVIDFYATWCGPCKKIAPELAKLAEANSSVAFYKVDVEELEEVAAKQQIQSMPTFKIFSKGECVRQIIGASIQKLGDALAEVGEAVGATGIKSKVVLEVPAGTVFPLKKTEQLQSLLNHPKVVVCFSASWCGPCNKVAPEVAKLAAKYDTIKFAKLDVEELEAVAENFSVTSLPTFVYFQSGVEMQRVLGANLDNITAGLDALLLAKTVPTTLDGDCSGNPAAPSTSATPAAAPAPAAAAPAPAAAAPKPVASNPAAPAATGAPVFKPAAPVSRDFAVLPTDLATRIRAGTHTLLFFPLPSAARSGGQHGGVSASASANATGSDREQTEALATQLDAAFPGLAIVTVGPAFGWTTEQVAQIAKEYGVKMTPTAEGGDLPAYKLLCKGIHYATVTDGNMPALDRKLRELMML